MKPDNSILLAYVDGELDPESAHEVEAALETDAEARETVRAFRESAALVRSALNEAIHEPVPPRLVEAAGGLPGAGKEPRVGAAAAKRRRWFPGLALAASLAALVIGFESGNYVAGSRVQQAAERVALLRQRADIARQEAIDHALQRTISGTAVKWNYPGGSSRGEIVPIRTFRNKFGQYCREFRDLVIRNDVNETAFEVRCRRDDGVWAPRYRLVPFEQGRK